MTPFPNSDASLLHFLKERCDADPNHSEAKSAFYAAYRSWAIAKGLPPLPINAVGREMVANGFTEFRSKSTRFWKGIRTLELHVSASQTEANSTHVPETSISSPEMVTTPLVEESKSVLHSNGRPRDELLSGDAVKALLLKNMMGVVEIRRL